jgi:hypothetical protein
LEYIEELEIEGKFGGNAIARVTMDNLRKLRTFYIEENSQYNIRIPLHQK